MAFLLVKLRFFEVELQLEVLQHIIANCPLVNQPTIRPIAIPPKATRQNLIETEPQM
jgi:hypothetical protein